MKTVEIVDMSDGEVTSTAGVFAVTVDTGSRFVTVHVYYEYSDDIARIYTVNLSQAVVDALVTDAELKAEFREAIKAVRDVEREEAERQARKNEAMATLAKARWN